MRLTGKAYRLKGTGNNSFLYFLSFLLMERLVYEHWDYGSFIRY